MTSAEPVSSRGTTTRRSTSQVWPLPTVKSTKPAKARFQAPSLVLELGFGPVVPHVPAPRLCDLGRTGTVTLDPPKGSTVR